MTHCNILSGSNILGLSKYLDPSLYITLDRAVLLFKAVFVSVD